MDSSSFGSSAALPFTDKLSNTRGLPRGQIDQDRKDGRAIQKAQGVVSAAGTAPHKGSVRGRGHLRLLRPPRPRVGRWDLSIKGMFELACFLKVHDAACLALQCLHALC